MPPVAAAAVPIIAGIGGAIANQTMRGKGNTYQADPYSKTPDYDPNAFQYGGRPGGADADALRAQSIGNTARDNADAARATSGQYQNASFGLYGQGAGNLAAADAARAQQQQVAGLMMARAQGLTPSIADMQAQRDMARLQAAQASAAASARGPAAIALAQQNAMGGLARGTADISSNAQIASAQERLAAEQAAMGAYSGIRQGDISGAGTAFGAGSQYGQLGLGYGNLGVNYGQLGLGQDQLAHNIRQSQLDAGIRQQGLLANSRGQADMINSGIRGAEVARNDRIFDQTLDYLGKGLQGGGMGGGSGGGGGGGGGAPAAGGGGGGGGGTVNKPVPGGGYF